MMTAMKRPDRTVQVESLYWVGYGDRRCRELVRLHLQNLYPALGNSGIPSESTLARMRVTWLPTQPVQ